MANQVKRSSALRYRNGELFHDSDSGIESCKDWSNAFWRGTSIGWEMALDQLANGLSCDTAVVVPAERKYFLYFGA